MELSNHSINELFAQLGLASGDADIESFISAHRQLAGHTLLADAPFWTNAQAKFLRDEIAEDADWAEVVDRLNVMLHE